MTAMQLKLLTDTPLSKPEKYGETDTVFSDFCAYDVQMDAGREGFVTIHVVKLSNGMYRLIDVCEERVQDDGEEFDLYFRKGREKETVEAGKWVAKHFTSMDLPKRIAGLVVDCPFKSVPKTRRGEMSPEDLAG